MQQFFSQPRAHVRVAYPIRAGVRRLFLSLSIHKVTIEIFARGYAVRFFAETNYKIVYV